MRAVGLLAGVGSLLREAQDVGFTIVGNLETRAPYSTGRHLSWDLNFPDIPLIRKVEQMDQMRDWYRADLVIGHPPCGAHSQLGNSGQPAHKTTEERRAMQAVRHARAGLLPFYVEQVAAIKPKAFVLDNLPKILSSVAPKEWWTAALPKYDLQFITMMNWDYGIPQLRKRLWVVGTRKPIKPFVFKPTRKRLPGPATAMAAWDGLAWQPWINDPAIGHVHVGPDAMLTGDYRTTVEGLNVKMATQLGLGFLSIPPDKAWPYITRFGRLAVKIGRQRLAFDKYSRTITGLPSIHHPMTGWPLTARERARLMGWPDDFHLGNASSLYNRTELMRLTLFTGKAVPSGFPKFLLQQLITHLERHA